METINQHSLVLMVGPSGSGKSTLAAKHFAANEIVSSDNIRAELLGDFRIQTNQFEVWEEVHRRVSQRLAFGQRVVVDATNIKFGDRRVFVEMAKHFDVELVYLVVNRTVESKLKTAGWRLEVDGLIERHEEVFNNNLKEIMRGDGGAARVIKLFDNTELKVINHPLDTNDQLVNCTINKVNQPIKNDLMVVGDVHGNINELDKVVEQAEENDNHLLFLGDIIDYGYFNLTVFDVVYELVRTGKAHIIWGNHERKLDRWLNADFGRCFKGVIGQGLAMTVNEIEEAMTASPLFKEQFLAKWRFLAANSRQHFILGNFMFTHGAATKEMWDMLNKHTLYGEHQNMAYFGQVDKTIPNRKDGLPNRIYQWVNDIPTDKIVVVGHDPRDKNKPMVVVNPTGGKAIFLDTGSSKGGKLSFMVLKDFTAM